MRKQEILRNAIGRVTLRRLEKGKGVTESSLGPAAIIDDDSRVLTFPAPISSNWLLPGHLVRLVLAPSNKETNAPGEGSGMLEDVVVLQVGKQSADGMALLLVAVPPKGSNHATTDQLAGRTIAHPVYVAHARAATTQVDKEPRFQTTCGS
jgi:hypothetical protein